MSFWTRGETLAIIFKSGNVASKFERDLASWEAEFEDLHAESKPSDRARTQDVTEFGFNNAYVSGTLNL
jgi:hypothetical protein